MSPGCVTLCCVLSHRTVDSHSCLFCLFLESLENRCPCEGKTHFSGKAMPLWYHMAMGISGPSGSCFLLMSEVSGQAVFPMRNCRLPGWLLCQVHPLWCTSIGLCGMHSLTGKTGLSERKTAIWHLDASLLLGSLCTGKGFQQNAFSLMGNQSFWKKVATFGKHEHLVETLILSWKPAFWVGFCLPSSSFNWSFTF